MTTYTAKAFKVKARITDEQLESLKEAGMSNRAIAREYLGKESRESYIRLRLERLHSSTSSSVAALNAARRREKGPKVLILDIETAPLIAHLWSLWQNGIGLNQMQGDWHLLSYAAKWIDSDEVFYKDQRNKEDITDDAELLADIWELLNEADFVVGHNIRKFDIKKIKARMLLNGMSPPSTFRQIDTLIIAKSVFAFTSNKLEYLTDKLCKVFKKSKHGKFHGHSLWTECLKGNPEAWLEMESYNKYDILSNQELYETLAPWDARLPNFDLYTEEVLDNEEWIHDGFHYTNLGKYKRYRHKDTGQYRRGRKNLLTKEKRASLLSNIIA
ncbi:DNA-directed DNA polymerase [Serratia phage vB_SmaM-ChuuTotoro]|nr:DNA-directed DNA polymerase [Serratia phage vB_SmaM-ChuuTotoro]